MAPPPLHALFAMRFIPFALSSQLAKLAEFGCLDGIALPRFKWTPMHVVDAGTVLQCQKNCTAATYQPAAKRPKNSEWATNEREREKHQ